MGLNIRKEQSKNKLIFKYLVITVLVVSAMVLFYLQRSSSNVKLGNDLISKDAIKKGSKVYSIYLDGWSERSLLGNELRFVVRDEDGAQIEKIAKFEPLSKDDYNELLKSDPEILKKVLSYLISPSSNIQCDNKTCLIDKKSFDLNNLLSINYNQLLASTFQSLNIKNALYKAEVIYQENQTLEIVSPDDSSISLTEIEAPMEINNTTENIPDKASNLLGYSFGRAFIIDPLWATDKSLRWKSYDLEDSSYFINDFSDIYPQPFMRGLGSIDNQRLSGLSNSLLTYITSPITGCGIISLCVPAVIESNIKTINTSTKKICSKDNKAAYITVINQDIETILKGSFHIYGLWNGVVTQEGGILGYAGKPELSGGQVSFRNNLAILSNSRGEIFDFFGERGQFGIDTSLYTEKIYTLDKSFLKVFFGNYFKFC